MANFQCVVLTENRYLSLDINPTDKDGTEKVLVDSVDDVTAASPRAPSERRSIVTKVVLGEVPLKALLRVLSLTSVCGPISFSANWNVKKSA